MPMDVEQDGIFQGVTTSSCYTFKNAKKPNNDGLCYGVTDQNPPGEEESTNINGERTCQWIVDDTE